MVRLNEILNEGPTAKAYKEWFPPASCQEGNQFYFDALQKYFKTGNILTKWVEGKTYEIADGRVNILVSGINSQGIIDKLPIPFGEVKSFSCSGMGLKTLEGGPLIVNGDFYCDENKLTSLEFIPEKVTRIFICTGNPLESLNGLNFKKDIQGIWLTYPGPNVPLLRLLCAKEHIQFMDLANGPQDAYRELETIINEHIHAIPNIKERLVKCQYAMIKTGYKGNAKW